MAKQKPSSGGCLLAFVLFLFSQAAGFTAFYFTTTSVWGLLEKTGWITDKDGAGLTGVFVGMMVYVVIFFIANRYIEKWTKVDPASYIPNLPV